jgi:hypothetical protein
MMDGFLISLEGQNIIRIRLDDFTGDVFLTTHRVEGDNTAGQLQRPKQFRDGGDFVGLVADPELPEYHAVFQRPGIHDVRNGSLG